MKDQMVNDLAQALLRVLVAIQRVSGLIHFPTVLPTVLRSMIQKAVQISFFFVLGFSFCSAINDIYG